MEQFKSTIKRDENGAYVVSLPFKRDVSDQLGISKRMALARLFQIKKKFEKDEVLKKLYVNYISELIERGYMRKCETKMRIWCHVICLTIQHSKTVQRQKCVRFSMLAAKHPMG